jgi:hypothetical protein
VAANATRRGFVGFSAVTGAPTDAEPSASMTSAIGVGHDAADVNWQIMHRTAAGAMTKVDTGIAKAYADAVEMFELDLSAVPGASTIAYTFRRLSDGAAFSGTISTNLPAAATLLAFQAWNSVGGTSAVIGIALGSLYIESGN